MLRRRKRLVGMRGARHSARVRRPGPCIQQRLDVVSKNAVHLPRRLYQQHGGIIAHAVAISGRVRAAPRHVCTLPERHGSAKVHS